MRRREITQTLGTGAALLGVWLGFFLLDAATSRTLWPSSATPFAKTFGIDLLLASLWALMSAGIAVWHRRVRTLTSNVWVLFACHVPALVAAIDSETSRYISTHFLGALERQLTRLGDYLRLALECTDSRGITPERERALDAAVAALRDSGAYSHDLTLSA